jgi:hypothetical protein
MGMLFAQPLSTLPFRQWLWEDKENRRLLWISIIAIVVQFAMFKAFYPLPNFMPPDSSYYLEAASNNQTINFWATGYSKFLRLVSSLTRSDMALVIFQYLLLEASVLFLLFSLRYLTSTGRWAFRILTGVCILNPLLPHISNFVSSDSLFTALSLVWFTQLMWILYKPTLRLLLWHALVLVLAFMVRYNALYFPFISLTIILIVRVPQKIKWTGIAVIILGIGGFIGRTQYEYYKLTGTVQYSAFGGWQLAANSLYGYAYSKPMSSKSMPQKFKALHKIVNHHMDSLNRIPFIFRPDLDIGVYYLWDSKSPLKMYLERQPLKDSAMPYFNRWASVAPLYASYGRYIILHYPRSFFKHFAWQNFLRYYAPPAGFMESYNREEMKVDEKAVEWFGWKNNKIYNNFGDRKIEIAEVFSIILAILNLMFLASFIGFATLGGFKKCGVYSKRILWLTVATWLSNMVFSVFSAPIELRYQLFPMLIMCAIHSLSLSFLIEECKTVKTDWKTKFINDAEKADANISAV